MVYTMPYNPVAGSWNKGRWGGKKVKVATMVATNNKKVRGIHG